MVYDASGNIVRHMHANAELKDRDVSGDLRVLRVVNEHIDASRMMVDVKNQRIVMKKATESESI